MPNPTRTLDHQENVSVDYAIDPPLTAGGSVNHINVSGQSGSWGFGPPLSDEIGF